MKKVSKLCCYIKDIVFKITKKKKRRSSLSFLFADVSTKRKSRMRAIKKRLQTAFATKKK